MRISRRQFLTRGGLATAGLAITGKPAAAGYNSPELRTKGLKTTTTICPFCAVGCGMVVSVKDGKIVNIEGDDLHPINQGSLCSKGEAVFQVANNERRLQKVHVPRPRGRPLGGKVLGLGPGPDRPADEGNPRPDLQGHARSTRRTANSTRSTAPKG